MQFKVDWGAYSHFLFSSQIYGIFFLFEILEKARLQAEAKAAEEARKKAEAEAAAEGRRKRELEREAARQALQKVRNIQEHRRFVHMCRCFFIGH